MAIKKRTGRWAKEELEFVRGYVDMGLSYEQMAIQLAMDYGPEKGQRDVENIKETVESKMLLNVSEDAVITHTAEVHLKGSPEWGEIRLQFSEEEQELFLYHWRQLCHQFRNDVTHTERLQIIGYIRSFILLGRVFKRIQENEVDIAYFKRERDRLRNDPDADRQDITLAEAQYAGAMGANRGLVTERKELETVCQQHLKDIKGTRDQRIKSMDDIKDNFGSFISGLLNNADLRKSLGEEAERHRLAAHYEVVRLTEYHKFADGEIEQPILSAETLKDDNK